MLNYVHPMIVIFNYCMIIINALSIAVQRVIPFTKPSKGNHKKGRPGWNEYVALEFDHALHHESWMP